MAFPVLLFLLGGANPFLVVFAFAGAVVSEVVFPAVSGVVFAVVAAATLAIAAAVSLVVFLEEVLAESVEGPVAISVLFAGVPDFVRAR